MTYYTMFLNARVGREHLNLHMLKETNNIAQEIINHAFHYDYKNNEINKKPSQIDRRLWNIPKF